jgi:hypothetical protein
LFRAKKAALKYLTCSFAMVVFNRVESSNSNERVFAEKYMVGRMHVNMLFMAEGYHRGSRALREWLVL